MAIGAFTRLLKKVPRSLSGLGHGTADMVQHGMIGTTGRQLRGAMKKPIRKGGFYGNNRYQILIKLLERKKS